MHARSLIVLAAVAVGAVAAVPSYNADNAYPMNPPPRYGAGRNVEHRDRPTPTTTPCETPTPTPTPCETPTAEYAQPTPAAAGSQGGVRPDVEQRCPAPVTITRTETLPAVTRTRTLPAVTHTDTRTITEHRTATRTTTATVTATSTVVKPVVKYKTHTETRTKTCTETTTVEKVCTKTVHDVKTKVVYKTRTETMTDYVTRTHTIAAAPTGESRAHDEAPASDYGPVKPAYGPVKSYSDDADAAQDNDQYEAPPLALPTGNAADAYGYQ